MRRMVPIALLVAGTALLPHRGSAQTEVYRYTPASTFIQRGDTVWWIRPHQAHVAVDSMIASAPRADTASGSAKDTIIYRIAHDTVVLLQPKPVRVLPPALAKHFRKILLEAKEDRKLQEKLRANGKPPE
jgi:hypothetical protein